MSGGLRIRVARWDAPDRPLVTDADVLVFSASLLASDAEVRETMAFLSRDERDRFAEHTNAVVARRFAIGRRVVREVLGRALGVEAAAVQIRSGLHGKPALARDTSPRPLWFSVAHCDDLLLVALSRLGDVGVDVERARSIEQWERVADRVLDRAERMQLQCAVDAGEDAGVVFLRHWCRVEAELKAIGCGIHGLEAHRAGKRPLGLALADLHDIPLPVELADVAVRYQAALALCAPGGEMARQSVSAAVHDTPATTMPARTSTP